jgi:hypothetical protein
MQRNGKVFLACFFPKLPDDIQRISTRKLTLIHGAEMLDFLRVPLQTVLKNFPVTG